MELEASFRTSHRPEHERQSNCSGDDTETDDYEENAEAELELLWTGRRP